MNDMMKDSQAKNRACLEEIIAKQNIHCLSCKKQCNKLSNDGHCPECEIKCHDC